jgi:hypothetical protein
LPEGNYARYKIRPAEFAAWRQEWVKKPHDLKALGFPTCLAKIYAEFYRMSEDLDFVIPMGDGKTELVQPAADGANGRNQTHHVPAVENARDKIGQAFEVHGGAERRP